MDHCSTLDLIINRSKIGELYNISANNEMKNIDIIKMICKILNKPDNLIEFVSDRKSHDLRYSIDANKLYRKYN